MSTAPKNKMIDKNGDQFFPITHVNAVVDNNGDTIETWLTGKQDTLVSGINIKTINNQSILGSGNISAGGDISGCEVTSNKVTSLSSSSTDTQYPSAKCVYDIIGDVETLILAL